ncbi:MAG: hypothetical protein QXT16_08800 [Candidatus Caldarchaeum sp.]
MMKEKVEKTGDEECRHKYLAFDVFEGGEYVGIEYQCFLCGAKKLERVTR